MTFDACLAGWARRSPDAVALVDAGERLTFAELEALVGVRADRLWSAGVEGCHVALVDHNSVQHLVTAFAIWRAGATLVTVYPSSTASELEYVIAHSGASLVVAATSVLGTAGLAAAAADVPVVELGGGGELEMPRSALPPGATGDAALICYTSGSTARPKAVMHSHPGLLAAARAYAEVWHLSPADTTLVSMPLAWAFGLVTTSMATLAAGGRVVLLPRADPVAQLHTFSEQSVTCFAGVTTMYVKMVDALAADAALPRPSTLRLCISGGEPRNEAAFARWQQSTGCPVHDVYAASECFPVVTYDPLRDPMPRPGRAGRVVPGAELKVDAAGEAIARGPATMLGYWGDPELTATVLTPDGWYRTGDLVEVDDQGYVAVLGRLSDMIIRSGANVSPAEVEGVLVQHPGVREAAVVGLPDPVNGQLVVAAIVVDEAEIDLASIAAHCATSLASFKRPTRFVVLDELPRNASTGKVDRRRIAERLVADPATFETEDTRR